MVAKPLCQILGVSNRSSAAAVGDNEENKDALGDDEQVEESKRNVLASTYGSQKLLMS